MQITPIEIRQKRFEKKFRGYHADEVDAFLHSLAYTWEKLTTQFNELKALLEVYKKDLDRLKGLEDALLKTIQDADSAAAHLVAQANKESELTIKEAKLEANQLLHQAKDHAQAIQEKSKAEARKTKEAVEQELAATQLAIQETMYYQVTLKEQFQHLGKDLLAKSQALQNDIASKTPINK